MKQAIFLYNPQSGRGRIERSVQAIVDIFAAHDYALKPTKIDFTKNPFDGNETIDLMVVAGGDGTANFALNAMKQRGLDIPLGIIPAGTANDFAGAIGMSRDPLTAARQLATGEIIAVDYGTVNDLNFVNIFSFGLFTTTSQRTPDERKHRIGKLAYIIEGVKEFRTMHAIPLEIVADGRATSINALIALIFNGETAGSFRLARQSSVKDGLFDCILLEKKNLLVTLWSMAKYLCGGSPKAIHHLRAAELKITSPIDEPSDVDGQPGSHFPLHIRCHAGGLRILAPRK